MQGPSQSTPRAPGPVLQRPRSTVRWEPSHQQAPAGTTGGCWWPQCLQVQPHLGWPRALSGCSCSLQPHVPAAPGGGLRTSLPPSRPEPALPAPSSLFRSHVLTCCYPRAVCGGFPKPSSAGIYGEPEGKAKESLLKRSLDIS